MSLYPVQQQDWRGKKKQVLLALMIPFLVIMLFVVMQGPLKRTLAKQNQLRETFFFDRSNPTFCIRIQIRTFRWQSQTLHLFCFDQLGRAAHSALRCPTGNSQWPTR
jgi:hypothetical protein